MYERSLSEAELLLSSQKDTLLPVRKLWEEVVKQSKNQGFEVAALPDFSALLEGDRRFKIIPAQIKAEGSEENPAETELADEEMEYLGFYPEDRVKLSASRIRETEINEEEEEIGSIRRRAFVSQVEQSKIPLKKKSDSDAKETTKKPVKRAKASIKKTSPKLQVTIKTKKKKTLQRTKK